MRIKTLRKFIIRVLIIGLVLFAAMQLVPFGRNHTNPPIIREPAWDRPETRAIAKKACFNCHSNESEWPWYSFVAPSSWLLQYDVDQARRNINFSEWEDIRSKYLVQVLEEGEMPPLRYILLHPEAKLSDKERDSFITGLQATLD